MSARRIEIGCTTVLYKKGYLKIGDGKWIRFYEKDRIAIREAIAAKKKNATVGKWKFSWWSSSSCMDVMAPGETLPDHVCSWPQDKVLNFLRPWPKPKKVKA